MRNSLRSLKSHALRFREGAPAILIFGLRRGGSTMIADAIAECRGVWFANEPFAVLPAHPAYDLKRERLPEAPHSAFFGLEGADLARFEAYSSALLGAELRQIGTTWRPLMPLSADRVCLKILNATWMIGWFRDETEAALLTLLRHPGAQALSVMRQGWDYAVRAYVARPEALGEWLTPAQIDLATRIVGEGRSDWELAVLDWCVASAPLRAAHGDRHVALLYEDIVRAPEAFVDEVLVGRLGLADRDRMLARLSRPSGSSRMSDAETRAQIEAGEIDVLLSKWRGRVTDDMAQAGQAILDVFEVAEYRFD